MVGPCTASALYATVRSAAWNQQPATRLQPCTMSAAACRPPANAGAPGQPAGSPRPWVGSDALHIIKKMKTSVNQVRCCMRHQRALPHAAAAPIWAELGAAPLGDLLARKGGEGGGGRVQTGRQAGAMQLPRQLNWCPNWRGEEGQLADFTPGTPCIRPSLRPAGSGSAHYAPCSRVGL